MDKKVVLVTGGSRGIGLAISKKFAMNNYDVVINYNSDIDSANKAKIVLEEIGAKVLIIKADVSKEDEVKNMIDETIKYFGKINCVVNNAGICRDKELLTKDTKDFLDVLGVNLIGTFLVSKYSFEHLKKQENASIINISSTNGIDTIYPESIEYDASKAGVISMTRNMARDFAPYIRVNSIAPGWTDTDMNRDISPIYKKSEEEKILLGRFGASDEIANVVYFVASPEASYINSTVIRVDGGLKE